MTDTPDEVVEAGAKAEYERWRAYNNLESETPPWDKADENVKVERRICVRPAFAAGLAAWPNALRLDGYEYGVPDVIHLPLPKDGEREEPRKEGDGPKYWDDPDTYGYS
jgi:hypothetical protein